MYSNYRFCVRSDEVFQCFYGDAKSDALLHGHSYTGNPISCAAALEAMRQLRNSPLFESDTQGSSRVRDSFSDDDIRAFSLLPGVESVMGLGSVLAIELSSRQKVLGGSSSESPSHRGPDYVQEVAAFLRSDKIHVRYDKTCYYDILVRASKIVDMCLFLLFIW